MIKGYLTSQTAVDLVRETRRRPELQKPQRINIAGLITCVEMGCGVQFQRYRFVFIDLRTALRSRKIVVTGYND